MSDFDTMGQLLLATRNDGKLREVRALLGAVPAIHLAEVPQFNGIDAVESGETFLDNALIKARWAAELSGFITVADDSGLVVDALDGAPGVYSARYAGIPSSDAANNTKLVAELAGVPATARTARFVCCVVLLVPEAAQDEALNGFAGRIRELAIQTSLSDGGGPVWIDGHVAQGFHGVVEGQIVDAPRGENGFGYDPHFLLPSRGLTTAELAPADKNAISHRGQAFRAFQSAFLRLTEA